MLAVGLLFKVGAAPFHVWTPDVYQGAPTPVTGFMAACTKVAAFGALLRVIYVALPGEEWDWRPAMWGVAILTMILGSVIAIVQTDVKRMLAYSSIAHAGFLLTGVLALDQGRRDRGAVLPVRLRVHHHRRVRPRLPGPGRRRGGGGRRGHSPVPVGGAGQAAPVAAGVFTLFLLAMAGIPLTSGFMGKYAVFAAAVENGAWVLALIGVLASAVAAFFYVRVIVLMYFSEPSASAASTVATPGFGTLFAIMLAAVVTIVLGIAPTVLFGPAEAASVFLR